MINPDVIDQSGDRAVKLDSRGRCVDQGCKSLGEPSLADPHLYPVPAWQVAMWPVGEKGSGGFKEASQDKVEQRTPKNLTCIWGLGSGPLGGARELFLALEYAPDGGGDVGDDIGVPCRG